MNTQEVEDLLANLQDHYDERIDDTRINRWERALGNADAEAVIQAAEQYIAEQPRFFPKPAELVKLAGEIVASNRVYAPRDPVRVPDLEERRRYLAKRQAESRAALDRRYPPDQFPFDGLLRSLYATGRMTPEQRQRAESRLTPEQRRQYRNAFGSRRDDLPLAGKGFEHGR
jgi:hypothetical protein